MTLTEDELLDQIALPASFDGDRHAAFRQGAITTIKLFAVLLQQAEQQKKPSKSAKKKPAAKGEPDAKDD